MTTDDERPEENDANTAEEDPSAQEMEAYIKALNRFVQQVADMDWPCLLYTSPSPRDS